MVVYIKTRTRKAGEDNKTDKKTEVISLKIYGYAAVYPIPARMDPGTAVITFSLLILHRGMAVFCLFFPNTE